MAIDFEVDPRVAGIARRTADFVRDTVLPAEAECHGDVHAGPEPLRRALQEAARAAGVFAPHVPRRWGGLGLDLRGQAVVFEAAGYSLLGPLALNCAAPDEGKHAPPRSGRHGGAEDPVPRSPGGRGDAVVLRDDRALPGAGSDPRALATTAVRVPGGWRINGRKWFISGADGAAFTICMARTSGEPGDPGGATMFLVGADNPGMKVVRNIGTLDRALFAGHSELAFDDCEVPDDAVLGVHQALGYFKLAVIAEGIHARHLAGQTVGPGFDRVGSAVPELLRSGLSVDVRATSNLSDASEGM